MRYFLFFLFLFNAVFIYSDEKELENIPLSTSEQIATAFYDEDTLIGGFVSPVNGSLLLTQIDLIVNGAQSLILQRYYQSPYVPVEFEKNKQKNLEMRAMYLCENYRGWQYFPHIRIQAKKRDNDFEVRIVESNGATFDFHITKEKTTLLSPCHGVSNFSVSLISAKNDIRNAKIKYLKEQNIFVVHSPKGQVRYYKSSLHPFSSLFYCDFFLEKEILPNGKVLKYSYNNLNHLESIRSYDPKEKLQYANIKIEGHPNVSDVYFNGGSSKTSVHYFFGERKYQKGKYKEKGGKKRFKHILPPILNEVSSCFYKEETQKHSEELLLTEFNGKDICLKCEYEPIYGKKISQPHFRVKKLFFPVDKNDSFLPVYEFTYDPPEAGISGGNTQVKKSDGSSIIYYFSKELLPTAINYLDKKNKPIKTKYYKWNENQWLLSEEIQDSKKHVLVKKSYKYDQYGNPIEEIISGNLTGNSQVDSYKTRKKFSQDGRHLLLEEENEDGKLISFEYLPNTHLITSKITKDKNKDKIIIREFYQYDESNNLIREIVDDTNSEKIDEVDRDTERKIIEYFLKKDSPFIQMVEWKIEKYLDGNKEKILKKIKYLYDEFGNVCQEDIYDANKEHVYSIKRKYNERGDLLFETQPIDIYKKDSKILKAKYDYDSKGRLIENINYSGRLHTNKFYDTSNRLKKLEKKGSNNIQQIYNYEYDENDNLTKKIDPYQNITKYIYEDPFCSLPTVKVKPSIRSFSDNILTVKTHTSFDALEREISKTDANGNTIFYEYNVYNNPTKISYPDGSIERFTYYKNGNLKTHTDQDGLVTKYEYDLFDRITSKKFEKNNQELAKEKYSYNSFHLISEINKEGRVTKYSYDKAGRKIVQVFEGRKVEYFYDSIGRLKSILKHNGLNSLVISYEKDLQDRILEEIKEDLQGKILHKISYKYDDDGNMTSIIRYIQGKKAITSFTYDSLGRKIEEKDADGFITSTYYNDNYSIDKINKSLRVEDSDVKKNKTYTLFDAFGRKIKKEIKNAKNELISKVEYFYDPNGNLIHQKDYIFEGIRHVRDLITNFDYNQSNLLISLTRAYGSANQRNTYFNYSSKGKLLLKKMPSGKIIYYKYNPFGYLEKLISSDGKIFQTFTYDLLGNLKGAKDHIQKTYFTRFLDNYGNVIKEEFSNGLMLKKEYDDFDRPLYITYPDESNVQYQYDPLYMRKIRRFDRDNKFLYEHSFEKFDNNGNLLLENTINNFGSKEYNYDLLGRKTSINDHYFYQQNSFDEKGCLIKSQEDHITNFFEYDDLSQLISERKGDLCINYGYDSNFNHRFKDNQEAIVNELDEISQIGDISCLYDMDGRLTDKISSNERCHFIYDPLNRLLEANTKSVNIQFTYDSLGRRLSKKVAHNDDSSVEKDYLENYLYDGILEIGAYNDVGTAKQLSVIGLRQHNGSFNPIALEINNNIYLPIIDYQGNIRKIMDFSTRKICDDHEYTSFGEETKSSFDQTRNPYKYLAKRYDEELNLYCFGQRYYDPILKRWLTTDPEGFSDSMNLYQFLLNNPYLYVDPDGRTVWTIPLYTFGLATGPAGWLLIGALTAATLWVGYETYQHHAGTIGDFSPDIANAVSLSFFEVMAKGTIVDDPSYEMKEISSKEKRIKRPQERKIGKRSRLNADSQATGEHSVIKRNLETGNVEKYVTYKPQTNPQNPNNWELVKRYDGNTFPHEHYNKYLDKYFETPHVHDPSFPGGVRYPQSWEMPK